MVLLGRISEDFISSYGEEFVMSRRSKIQGARHKGRQGRLQAENLSHLTPTKIPIDRHNV
jgi:hypothetical protein